MRVTQGCFSFLPDLTDEQISAQVQYCLGKGWAVNIEFTDDPHPRNTFWEMWGLPMFDLRDAAEFKKGHIVNAINIPAAKLPTRSVELEKYKDRPVVLICKMGQQSGAAGKQLKAENFTKVYKMTGGMMEWTNLQLPTVA